MKKFLRLLPSFLTNAVFYKEPFFHYDPHFLKQDPYQKRYFINGYFQSPLYFNHVKADIKTIYQLKKPFSQKAKQIQEKIQTTVIPVSIHFRAGDYLTKENAKVHNVMDESYYKRAVAIMQKMYGEKVHFFIFSDDPKAAKALFHWLLQKDIIEPDPEHPEEDLFLMSFCHHHILANSSYSWWGAWLNNNLKKTVIAPLHWVQRDVLLKDSRLDLYDEGWIILK